MKRADAGIRACALLLLSVCAGGTSYGGVTFGDQDWTVHKSINATVTESGGNVGVEFNPGTTGGEYWLHVNRAIPDINGNGTPFVSFSFVVDAIAPGDQFLVDLFIDDEGGVNPSDATLKNPRHEANFVVDNRTGTLVQYVQGTEKYTKTGSGTQSDIGIAPISGGLNVEQTLSIGKLADGTVEYNLAGYTWTSSFLRDSYGSTDFEFGDIYLRIRDWGTGNDGVVGGGKVTFTDFQTSASPVPEPGTLTLLGIGGMGLLGGVYKRRKKA